MYKMTKRNAVRSGRMTKSRFAYLVRQTHSTNLKDDPRPGKYLHRYQRFARDVLQGTRVDPRVQA